jgi:hypothetical protein
MLLAGLILHELESGFTKYGWVLYIYAIVEVQVQRSKPNKIGKYAW